MDQEAALRHVLEGTSAQTGRPFFRALVRHLSQALGTSAAWVTEFDPQQQRLSALAFWLADAFVEKYEYLIAGTPCAAVVNNRDLLHIPDNIVELYPGDNDLRRLGAVSFLGLPLLDTDEQTVLGHLAVLDSRSIPADERALAIMRIFAARASAELRRMRVEGQVADQAQRLGRLLDGAMDAVLEVDSRGRITVANRAAERIFDLQRSDLEGAPLETILDEASVRLLSQACDRLDPRDPATRSALLPGTLNGLRRDGPPFPIEATAACYTTGGHRFYTLILRDVRPRIAAEQTIQALAAEREYLREQLDETASRDLLGSSRAMQRLREQIHQVAPTDATVLIHGETGTGKELVARALHAAGKRAHQPLIRVNCAAIPAALMESEFYGHERGSFTGATQKRVGRFALADGGTIFLDEVGELPLELQAKLLRVLQEGEFEPVGSSEMQKVDVRVIAATNRDLSQSARDGTFREDLYYRLNVFPIYVPPLRERSGDIAALAQEFARRCALKLGRRLEPISTETLDQLARYPWPGNVRELQNVIERAVITAGGGRLRFDGLIAPPTATAFADPTANTNGRVMTLAELQALERNNLLAALNATLATAAPPGCLACHLPPSPRA